MPTSDVGTHMSWVYILKSLYKGSYYIGCTNNYYRRFTEHQAGKVRSTKGLRPLKLVLVQEYNSLSLARRIESKLKKLKRKDYIDKIIKDGKILMDS